MLQEQSHPNSKKITIFRADSFIDRAQQSGASEYLALSRVGIGAYWESINTQKVGSGLSFEEEELLMPRIIDVVPEDRDFRKKVTEFFSEINTDVPYGTGVTLEVGLQRDNSQKVSKDNMPVKLMDYLRYRHAMGHPKVAKNKETAIGNQMISFYIFDKDDVQNKNSKKVKERDAAFAIYLKVKEDGDQVDQLLTLLGVDPREYNDYKEEIRPDMKVERLRKLAEDKPADFTKAYEEGDLTERAWIQTMVNTGVLKKIGQKYLDAETNEPVGNSLEEAIFFFKDEENSGAILVLKARMQEGLRKPIVAEKRRTRV